jgi:prolyl 4-hydroxylase
MLEALVSVAPLAAFLVAFLVVLLVVGRLLWIRRNRRRYPVREIPGFLSDHECAHLIARAEPVMRRSKVVEEGTRSHGQIDRDSSTAFLDQRGDRVVRGIKLRIAAVVDAPVENQERIQVTHYLENQSYELHHDALRTANVELGESGDRIHTLIIYLNDDYEGGATYFPRIRRRIRPEKGKAVLFRNLTEDGRFIERLSLHKGEPVRGGEKWLSNQWIRQYRRQPTTAQGRGRQSGAKRRKR